MNNDTANEIFTGQQIITVIEGAESLSEMEDRLRRLLWRFGQVLLSLWLGWLTPRYNNPQIRCPHCGGKANYQRKRQGQLLTVYGTVKYRRAYYTCATCQQGHYPLDDRLGLRPNAMSAEVERLAGQTGVQMPFGKGRDLFEALTLLSLSDHSLGKATQAYGEAADEQEQAWIKQAKDDDELLRRERENKRPMRLYGAIDGGRVQTRGPKGEDQPWRELKVGAWFEAKGQPPKQPDGQWHIQAENITYYADIAHADDFGERAWATGVQRNAQLARELVFLGDGARWIWDVVAVHFPHAIQIVDWFHACEYLTPVAKAAFRDQQQQACWITQTKTDLWHGQLDTVIATCAQLVDAARDDDPAQRAVTYFTNNRDRMNYPIYRANGYQIGSGTIESGVKQIAQQRLKVPGARWNVSSARLVAKARAAFLSGQWDVLASRSRRLPKCA